MQITFDRKTVSTCLQQRFVLPTYQRDYKWEQKHLQELMADIQEAFLASWKPAHGRRDILGYEQYFLGTIITTQVPQGEKAIVDGQQRITTLALLLCYVHRVGKANPALKISPVDQSIRRVVAGENEFNLELDQPRKALFNLLVDETIQADDLTARIESIPGKDAGTERLWLLYQEIEKNLAADVVNFGLLPHLFDYLTDCVCMFEIGVPREQDGHKVFVTMNDRGLKLSPIDLLKGFLLSGISADEENRTAHASWTACVNQLKNIGSDEDSNFFKTWLRAKYANTSRGKKRGDAPGDFELIGDSYHRWVMDFKDRLDLKNSDDFSNLLTGTLPFYVDLYCKVKKAEQGFQEPYPHVYFNGARDLTLQAMVVLSSVNVSDTKSEVNKKIKLISYYLDYLATVRVLNGKENTYDNVRDLLFELTREVRGLDSAVLRTLLKQKFEGEKETISAIANISYDVLKRQDLLHLLARLGEYLEQSLDVANRVGFADYVDRSRDSRTFDVEHLLADKFVQANSELLAVGEAPFASNEEFVRKRHSVGGLILLPRGRNRSMKAMTYTEKVARYSTENVLAQTLTPAFYMNQPNWNKFSADAGITCAPTVAASSSTIDLRTLFYLELAKNIWSVDQLEAMSR